MLLEFRRYLAVADEKNAGHPDDFIPIHSDFLYFIRFSLGVQPMQKRPPISSGLSGLLT